MFTLDDDIMRQLRAAFRTEAAEHVQAMNNALLALEKGPDAQKRTEIIRDLFREAHSVKGAAGAADIAEVEATGHRLESILDRVRNDELPLTADLFDLLYEAIDAVNTVTDATMEDRPHGLDLETLYQRLDAAKTGIVIPRNKPAAAAASAETVQVPPVASVAVATLEPIAPDEPEELPEDEDAPEPDVPVEVAKVAAPVAAPAVGKAAKTPEAKSKARKPGANTVTEETIRVSTNKLDDLMTQAGELLVAGLKIDQRVHEVEALGRMVEDWHREWLKMRATLSGVFHDDSNDQVRPLMRFVDQSQQRLKELSTQVTDLRRGFAGDALHLARVTNDLGEDVMRVRMLPVSTVFDTFPRMVRDLSRELGKQIELEIAGGETELDRKVLEQIKDPLVHTLRNAVDHGIEMPDVRVRAGKDPSGTVVLSAYQKGNNIVIQISDDGAGIDVEKVKRSALKNGLISSEEAESMGDYEAMRLVFASGLSTSAVITDVSGRGVGMDVVRKNVEELHGSVDVESTLGHGTTLTLTLPLTLATTLELLVKVHDQTFGIPISAVERIQRINIDEIRTVEAKEAIIIDNEPVTLVHLAQILELPFRDEDDVHGDHKVPVVILKAGRKRIAFQVEAVVGQQESVVKSLGKQLKRVRNVAGATILGTGRIIMSLNPLDLIKCARLMAGSTAVAHRAAAQDAAKVRKPRVLVVDDSLTTRNLEKTILETAGYEVEVAINGAEALHILRADPCDVVVSDVLMPELDGFELTATMRKDPHLSDIPVILVTSLDSRSDRERGIDVGANAYIVKSAFEQDSLLSTIERLA